MPHRAAFMTTLPTATTDYHIKINKILDIEGQPIVEDQLITQMGY